MPRRSFVWNDRIGRLVHAASFSGAPLCGANSYEIVFPQGQLPPVSAFWSLILYNSSYQLSGNPINRYEIASHTPGLIVRSDGSLSITVSNTQPTDPTSPTIRRSEASTP